MGRGNHRLAGLTMRKGAGVVTDQLQPDETISFRSQNKRFLVPLAIAFGLGLPMVVGLFYLNDVRVLHLNDNLDPLTWKQYLTIVVGFPLFYLVACFLFLSQPGVGNYRINRDGIEHTPFRQNPKFLRWQDVERMKWGRDLACFEGKGTSISILWTLISTKDETPARPFMKEILSPSFDLSIETVDRWSFHRRLFGLYLAGAAAVYGLFVGFPFLEYPLRLKVDMIWFTLFAGVSLVLAIRAFKDKRVSEQLDPPWRSRRNEGRTS